MDFEKTQLYAAHRTLNSALRTHTQAKSEGMEKDMPCTWKPEENKGSCT